MTTVAINGLGWIGRATLKIVMETPELNLVAVNDIRASASVEYLLKYDTVYGRYEKPVQVTDYGDLTIGDHRLRLLREKDPARLPWNSMNVDIVFECTGAFTRREDLDGHIRAALDTSSSRRHRKGMRSKPSSTESIRRRGTPPSSRAQVAPRTASHP